MRSMCRSILIPSRCQSYGVNALSLGDSALATHPAYPSHRRVMDLTVEPQANNKRQCFACDVRIHYR